MLVLGDESVAFNRLRAVFPMQIKPPFGYTDFVGEYASSGFPRVDANGGITSANDDVDNPDQGNLEFDPIARAIYPRALFVLHDNDFALSGTSGDTGKTGNALIVWHDGSAEPSIPYGSVLPGQGGSGSSTGTGTSSTGTASMTETESTTSTTSATGTTPPTDPVLNSSGSGSNKIVQGPFARTQVRAPGFTSTQISVAQASASVLSDPYSEIYGKSTPVYGDFRVYGDIAGVGGCQGFTGFMRLFPPADGALNPPPATSTSIYSGTSGMGTGSSSASTSSSSSGTSSVESTFGSTQVSSGSINNINGFHFFNYQVTSPFTLFYTQVGAHLEGGSSGGGPQSTVTDWILFKHIARMNEYVVSWFDPPSPYTAHTTVHDGKCFIYNAFTGIGSFSPGAPFWTLTNDLYILPNSSYTQAGPGREFLLLEDTSCYQLTGGNIGSGSSGGGGSPFRTGPGGAHEGGDADMSTGTGSDTGIDPEQESGSTQSSASTAGEGEPTTGTGTSTGNGSGSGSSGGLSLVGGGGLASYTMLAFRLVGSGRAALRWYSILWEVGGMVSLCYNDATDNNGNPLDSGWVVADKFKMGGGRDAVLEPDSANTYVQGPTANDWTIGLSGENFPGKIISGLPVPGKAHTEEKLPKLHPVEVRVIGGQIRAHFESEDTPLLWPVPETGADGVPDWFIDRFMVTGGDVYGAEWSVHPTKFAPSAALISNPINMGFVPDAGQLATLAYRTHYTPDFKSDDQVVNAAQIGFHPSGHAATVETYETFGTELRYKLAFTNPASGKTYRGLPYAHATSAVRAVGLDVPGTEWSLINPPTVLGMQGSPPKPEGIDVYHNFDFGSLSIQSSAVLTFSNFTGLWTNGEGTGIIDTTGHFGIGIELGTNVGNTLNREFTGIANTEFTNDWGGGGKDKVSVFCRDCWTFLDVPIWNLPWMDGFNVFYAMAYLAELGTITRSQMNFVDLIPDNPYGRSPGLPDEDQYFLPIGPAGTQVTRFGGGETLRTIMLKISQSIGFTLFFDVYGGLNFYKFKVNPPSGYTRTFSHVPGDAQNPGEKGTDEIWAGGSYRGGLSDTKNSVTVIGVNALGPLWNPIVSHQADTDSVFDDSVANYKGFYDSMVWADNQFVDLSYADAAGSSMLRFLRLPDRQVSFSSWYPGGNPVYPGDLIQIRYPRSGASLHTYFVVSTHASRHQGQLPRLDISARLIPD